jgi:hypothetical protein
VLASVCEVFVRLCGCFAIALVVLVPGLISGETPGHRVEFPPAGGDGSISPNLRLLTRHSGMIFSGTAIRVEHLNPESASGVASTRITFRVQTAIRGVRAGQIIQIREWDGLWNSGERYRAGERVLLFLYRASRLGLTSPVGGRLGRFRVDEAGRVELQSTARDGQRPKPIELRIFAAEVRRAAKD